MYVCKWFCSPRRAHHWKHLESKKGSGRSSSFDNETPAYVGSCDDGTLESCKRQSRLRLTCSTSITISQQFLDKLIENSLPRHSVKPKLLYHPHLSQVGASSAVLDETGSRIGFSV